MHSCRLVLVALSASLLFVQIGVGCSPDRDPGAPQPGANVLLIVVDTLRADKLGCSGSQLGLTPNIDAFATQSVRFEQAFAHAPWTLPSMASMLTSLYPISHGAGGELNKFKALDADVRTLAEVFRDAGYATGAVVNVPFLGPSLGMHQGYSPKDYSYKPPKDNQNERRAGETTAIAVNWIRAHKSKPFFYMAHYFDPHLTYDPPAEFRKRFASPQDQVEGEWIFGSVQEVMKMRRENRTLPPTILERLEKLYNGEIAYTDRHVGRLLQEIETLGLAESTIVVFTSDHGEEFMDHGGFEHGHTVYNELIHVPLLIRFPPKLKPRTVSSVVRHIDLAPTLCELAGVSPDPAFLGNSLVKVIEGADTVDRPFMAEGEFWGERLLAWRSGGYKLIKTGRGVELYHVATDSKEKVNVAIEESDKRDVLTAEIDHLRELLVKRIGATAVLTPAERAELESLGYAHDSSEDEDTGAEPQNANDG